jgi:hypothetical protein
MYGLLAVKVILVKPVFLLDFSGLSTRAYRSGAATIELESRIRTNPRLRVVAGWQVEMLTGSLGLPLFSGAAIRAHNVCNQ